MILHFSSELDPTSTPTCCLIPRVFSFFLHPHMDKKNWQKLLTDLGGKISNLFALDYTIKASKNWLYYIMTQQILNEFELITFIFFQACERAESSKSCNLIRSESGWYFTILPTNPGGIIDCFIHKFVCCLWNEQKPSFSNHFSLKTCAVIIISQGKVNFIIRTKNLKCIKQASQENH